MDFNDTPEQAKFRAQCREWLETNAELKENKSSGHSDSSLETVSYTHLTLPTKA